MFPTNLTPDVQLFSRAAAAHNHSASTAEKPGHFRGEGGSVAAAGLVAAHRQHCGVVVPANASGGCR